MFWIDLWIIKIHVYFFFLIVRIAIYAYFIANTILDKTNREGEIGDTYSDINTSGGCNYSLLYPKWRKKIN